MHYRWRTLGTNTGEDLGWNGIAICVGICVETEGKDENGRWGCRKRRDLSGAHSASRASSPVYRLRSRKLSARVSIPPRANTTPSIGWLIWYDGLGVGVGRSTRIHFGGDNVNVRGLSSFCGMYTLRFLALFVLRVVTDRGLDPSHLAHTFGFSPH